MPDIIHLLPDSVANQIAAGEVIQRPASAVKEMMENALDAGASTIRLIIKDAGKALIQVSDDGQGMSASDAHICFERHATSKISKAEDLFSIRTMGFRGEALASMAAIAQVELKTRREEDEIGILIQTEGSSITREEPCQCPKGTTISIKNLFYNIPARRNFLKSNAVEMRHIIDEFLRIALSHPDRFFSLHHEGQEVYHLPKASPKQRIVHVFGHQYSERLVPVEEDTNIIRLQGFAGKPDYAKKTRGEQFFFVNNRYIRDGYLHHAVMNAYEELLVPGSFPFYVLFISIDPAAIDVNVHPTKTEIKFEDEKPVYAIIRSAVKRSLGRYNIAPSLDFEADQNLVEFRQNPTEIIPPVVRVDPDFNPFSSSKGSYQSPRLNLGNWEQLYSVSRAEEPPPANALIAAEEGGDNPLQELQTYQLHQKYILSHIKSGCIVIDQQAAHERILYERYLQQLENKKGSSQQNLFPRTVELSPGDFSLVMELQEEIKALGFDFREFGKTTIIIDGSPADLAEGNEDKALESLVEDYKQNLALLKLDKRNNLARSLAKNAAVKAGTRLNREEMNRLIDELFACKMPKTSVSGKPTFITIGLDELAKRFEKL
ncbi:DNA mismatch repair protein MutL [Anseongella ginsenosidimutans]|uniref:DNA mismatch repair protein MutL n=1 Tax=Anseongella ginsenosidimutans TaxID=496056 RepID=A0A4R3KQS1_9SPHI|nr:DNA mismatch repair endonuclease MutL [Anseongella ginsenosidimutans]QEC52301.1 DNA mismatch repair endonuclease MutL [Anseongella ginsenosidimutans]TCS86860.1 DNA mismatch repair protein MutL [Anseongella ginsenosidimutans]